MRCNSYNSISSSRSRYLSAVGFLSTTHRWNLLLIDVAISVTEDKEIENGAPVDISTLPSLIITPEATVPAVAVVAVILKPLSHSFVLVHQIMIY